jgi:hypothetical protein
MVSGVFVPKFSFQDFAASGAKNIYEARVIESFLFGWKISRLPKGPRSVLTGSEACGTELGA